MQLSDGMNRNELLDEVDSEMDRPYGELGSVTEISRKTALGVCGQGPQTPTVLGSTWNAGVLPPLPDFDLSLICEIMSF